MQAVTTIGLDIAKSVFQVHGVDAEGKVLIRRKLKRRYVLAFFEKLPPCLVGIEACVTSHHWSRELKGLGHSVRLMPPAYVKPYVKRQTRLIHAPAAMDRLYEIDRFGERLIGCVECNLWTWPTSQNVSMALPEEDLGALRKRVKHG
jgi:transposase